MPEQRVSTICHYQGTIDALPPEVVALGTPRSIHRPWSIDELLLPYRKVFFGVGGVLLLGPFLVAAIVRPDNNFPFFICSIIGIAVGALPFIQGKKDPNAKPLSFLVFNDALVAVEGDECTLIPWDEIPQHTLGDGFTTSEGKKFSLHGMTMVSDVGRLLATVIDQVMARQLPRALAAVKAGQTVTFGPFAVSTQALTYDGKTVPWSEITKMTIVGPRQRRLVFECQGAMFGWTCLLGSVPNDFVMLEVIRQICPSHLLVPKYQ
jgi:hypothetical protein